MALRLALASDHGGFALKQHLLSALRARDLELLDLGPQTADSIDYPAKAKELCSAVLEDRAELGILLCGTGIGMSIAANRYPRIRAALCTDPFMARMAREHNDANVLVLGGRVLSPALAEEIVDVFLASSFEGGRHGRRIAMLDSP
jgi:ribose 5-phosphate isomerase B